jgi:hypothetical protein
MTRPARFTQPDVTRAVKAFEKAGLTVARVRFLPDGGFELLTDDSEAANDRRNPLDRLYG